MDILTDTVEVVLELEGRTLGMEEQESWLQRARKKKLLGYQQTQIYEAQELAKSLGRGVKVGVIDSGINYNHDQFKHLRGRVRGTNLSGNGPFEDLLDTHGHGTQVTGIICGKEIGIAPEVELYLVKIDVKNIGTVVLALDFCENESCDIINLSLSAERYNSNLELACQQASEKGALLIASAGNRPTGASFPASFSDYVISVGSIDPERKYASGTIWSKRDVVAPGDNIFTTSTQYQLCFGTSYAAAHVTGILALAIGALKEKGVSQNSATIRTALQATADRSIYDTSQAEKFMRQYDPCGEIIKSPDTTVRLMFGSGLVQAGELLTALQKEYNL